MYNATFRAAAYYYNNNYYAACKMHTIIVDVAASVGIFPPYSDILLQQLSGFHWNQNYFDLNTTTVVNIPTAT